MGRKIRVHRDWKDPKKGNLARLVVTASCKERITEIARKNKIPKSKVVELGIGKLKDVLSKEDLTHIHW